MAANGNLALGDQQIGLTLDMVGEGGAGGDRAGVDSGIMVDL